MVMTIEEMAALHEQRTGHTVTVDLNDELVCIECDELENVE